MTECKHCIKKCPQEELACEIAKGRMYATNEVIKLQKELQRYKDLEERGELIKLPCAVGDTIYLVDVEEQAYETAKVDEIVITKDGIEINSDLEIGTSANADYIAYDIEEIDGIFKEFEECW